MTEPYSKLQSLTWVQLTENQWLLTCVNYCFLNLINWHNLCFDMLKCSAQPKNAINSTKYVLFQVELFLNSKENVSLTAENKLYIERYIKEFEAKQRKEQWSQRL